eukprot:15969062-Heterocapsa_arctica.AAC.1
MARVLQDDTLVVVCLLLLACDIFAELAYVLIAGSRLSSQPSGEVTHLGGEDEAVVALSRRATVRR